MKRIIFGVLVLMSITLFSTSLLAGGQKGSTAEEINTITFVDTDAGSNMQLLFKEIVIPLTEKQENIKIDYIVSKGPEML